jgi:pimeloyl-ACP methyl ester carboxylesterase
LVVLSMYFGLPAKAWTEINGGQASQQNHSERLARYVGWYEIEFPVSTAFPFTQDDWHWAWNRKVIDFDPMPLWERLRIPVLVVYGDKDEKDNVPVRESVERLERMIVTDGNRDFMVRVFAGSGHALGDPKTNWIRKDFLDLVAAWVTSRHMTKQ